jgi:hypothetical protein
MNNLFNEYDDALLEKFEIIFDRATNEKTAKSNALDYYFLLKEQDKYVDLDAVIESAENYGFNFDDFYDLIEENE